MPWTSRLFGVLRVLVSSILVLAALLGGLLWWGGRKASEAIDRELRALVFKDPKKADFARVEVSLPAGKVSVHGIRAQAAGRRGSAGVEIGEASWQLPIFELVLRKPVSPRIRFLRAALSVKPSTAAAAADDSGVVSEAEAIREAVRVRTTTTGLRLMPARSFSVEEGTLRLESSSGGSALALESVQASLERLEPSGYSLRATGKIGSAKGAFLLEARLADIDSPCESEGQLKIERFSIADGAAYFPPDPEMRYKSGTANLSTQFNCKKGWLTASHVVEINDFEVEVSTGRKELFGVSVRHLKDLFKIEHLSFVVPMTGDFADPHIGISSSIEQILLKIVEKKFDDKSDAEKLARRGGDYFGRKLDKALKAWLKARRR